jgi:prefoldin subunit 5
MSTKNQPLDDKPQDAATDNADDFESAFEEYATKGQGDRDEYFREQDKPSDAESNDDADDAEAPDISEKLSTLEQENQKLKHSEASQRGRLGAYQRQINDLNRQLQSTQQPQTPEGKPQSDNQQRDSAAQEMGSDDWETFKEDFPDMARAFEARLNTDRQKQAQLEQQIQQLESTVQPIQQQAHDQQLQSEYARLESRHSDWQDVVNAPAFNEWLQGQNPAIQDLAKSESADDASALLDFYKRADGYAQPDATPTDKRQTRLANAQTVSRRGAAQQRGTPEDFDAAFEHYAAKRSRQR